MRIAIDARELVGRRRSGGLVARGRRDQLVELTDLGRFFERLGAELVGVGVEWHRLGQRRLLGVGARAGLAGANGRVANVITQS